MSQPSATSSLPAPGALDFTMAEYEARLAAVRKAMSDHGADTLLVDQIDHLVYLFGYLATAARYQAALIPLDGEPYLIVRELDLGTFLDQSWVRHLETFADDEESVGKVADAVGRLAAKRLAVEKDSNILTVARLRQLQAANPGVEIVDFSGVLWKLRLIKSAAELAYIRQAAQIADGIVAAGSNSMTPGVTDRETLAAMWEAAITLGADNTRSALLGRFSPADALVPKITGNPWVVGDKAFLEATPQYRGYSARVVRPVAVGVAARRDLDAAKRVVDIQDQQIAAIRPGAAAAEVDAICRKQMLDQGLKTRFPQLTAYTLGYQCVPRVSDHTRILTPRQDWRFEAGMVFHLVAHTADIAFSETIAVTTDGAERLTKIDRKLLLANIF